MFLRYPSMREGLMMAVLDVKNLPDALYGKLPEPRLHVDPSHRLGVRPVDRLPPAPHLPLEQRQHCLRDEPRPWHVDVAVAVPPPPCVEPVRLNQIEEVARPRHRHV
jgi:hypothetical protein